MTGFLPNNWRAIRAFYREALPDILEAGENEWGIDPYEWDAHGIINLTPIEEWLWHDIRACGAVFYPQFPVRRYFVDFANPAAKVALECDGAKFHDEQRDALRDRELRDAGWTVYRFPGWMCRTDNDPETGKPGDAMRQMHRICEGHELGRWASNRRARVASVSAADLIAVFERSAAIRAAVERSL